ncbi:hypothetical protein CR513_04433, partial [Mucuna pruriens]
MIDATSGGALMDNTLTTARHLISNMTRNTQQFGIRGVGPSQMVNEVSAIDNLRLENKLTELTSLVIQLVVGQHQPNMAARVYGICTSIVHFTNMCPTLQEIESDHLESVRSIGGYQYGKQPYQNIKRHRSNNSNNRECHHKTTPYLWRLDEVTGYKQPGNLNATIQDLKTQVVQLANTVSQLQSVGLGNLPAQTIPNLRGSASVVSLTSGRELPQTASHQCKFEPEVASPLPKSVRSVPLPFQNQTLSTRKSKIDEDLLKMFRKVEINIPLLDIPKHAKFLKELCVQKRGKMKGKGMAELSGIVSALTKNEAAAGPHQNLPKKCRDLEIFSVPCTIGECTFADAMLDVGASINVMPTSVYKSLNFGDLEPTRMTI